MTTTDLVPQNEPQVPAMGIAMQPCMNTAKGKGERKLGQSALTEATVWIIDQAQEVT